MPLREGMTLPLDGPQAHYLAKVMRVTQGDAVMLCDDMTGEWLARVTNAGKRDVMLEIERCLRCAKRCPISGCAPRCSRNRTSTSCSKRRPNWGRHDPPDNHPALRGGQAQPERARAIVTEAAGNARAPRCPCWPIRQSWRRWCATGRRSARCSSPTRPAAPAAAAFAAHPGPAGLLTGPEGGFDDAERALIRAHPAAVPISLGPRILRGNRGHRGYRAVDGNFRRLERLSLPFSG
jgi:16S rRNA (uracil1498-N3)-methyltransferase